MKWMPQRALHVAIWDTKHVLLSMVCAIWHLKMPITHLAPPWQNQFAAQKCSKRAQIMKGMPQRALNVAIWDTKHVLLSIVCAIWHLEMPITHLAQPSQNQFAAQKWSKRAQIMKWMPQRGLNVAIWDTKHVLLSMVCAIWKVIKTSSDHEMNATKMA